MNRSALQPIWDWLLRTFGAEFFAFPLYFLPVVVAVVLVTGVGYSILDVAVHRRISARAASLHGLRVMATYIGSAALLLYLNDRFHPIALEVPSAAPTLMSFVVQVALYMVAGEFLTYWWHRLEHGNKFVFTARALPASPRRVPVDHLDQLRRPPRRGADGDAVPVPPTAGTRCASIGHGGVRGANTTAMVVTHCGYDIRFYPVGCCRLPPATSCTTPRSARRISRRDELRRQAIRHLQADNGFR